jgi:hypothetical protein
MGQIRVTSGTDFAVRFVSIFAAFAIFGVLTVLVLPVVEYVLGEAVVNGNVVAALISFTVLVLWLVALPDDVDTYLDTLSSLRSGGSQNCDFLDRRQSYFRSFFDLP